MTSNFGVGYALLVGINESNVPRWSLPDVAKDINALQQVLVHPERCAYLPENVKTIVGPAATRQSILDGLGWLEERLQADRSGNATAVIYYTGHGWRDTASSPPVYYLIPYDVRDDVREAAVRARALRAEDFAAEIAALQPKRLLVLLDCCHAGGMGVKELAPGGDAAATGFVSAAIPLGLLMTGAKALSAAEGSKGLEQLAQGAGRAVLSSSQGEQRSYIRRDRMMSIFTYHLIEALTGHAAPAEGATEVLVSDVMSHVWRRVPASARADCDADQQPDYQVSGNFPVALLLGGKGLSGVEAAPDPLVPPPVPAAQPAPGAVDQHVGDMAGPGATIQKGNTVVIQGSGHRIGGDIVGGNKVTVT
jgi:uncharacterized caspase-like protein